MRPVNRPVAGVGVVAAASMPVVAVRKLANLSQSQMASALHTGLRCVGNWENGKAAWQQGNERAWVWYVSYHLVDPVHGWLRAALGLSPTGELPPKLVARLAEEAEKKKTKARSGKRKAGQ